MARQADVLKSLVLGVYGIRFVAAQVVNCYLGLFTLTTKDYSQPMPDLYYAYH